MSNPNEDRRQETDASTTEGTKSGKPSKPDEPTRPKEIGGPAGPEPTRYGDWERKGRCSDF